MKKLVKTAISVVLILSFIIPFAIPVSAAFEKYDPDRVDYTNPELDLSQYTVEQVLSMSKDEFVALLADFERVYGPFHTYETDDVKESVVIHQPVQKELEVQPQWKSGDFDSNGDYVSEELATHEMITQQAMTVMMNDVGFFGKEPVDLVAAILLLTVYSARPDYDENGSIKEGTYYEGHFYDPLTGKSYTGSTSNNALRNAISHYDRAVAAGKQGNAEFALEEMGRALHYIQDICQPHHTANITATQKFGVHMEFENYVNQDIDTYTSCVTTANGHKFYSGDNCKYTYSSAPAYPLFAILSDSAYYSRGYVEKIDSILDIAEWEEVAEATVSNSIVLTSLVLYKFSKECNVPLYK